MDEPFHITLSNTMLSSQRKVWKIRVRNEFADGKHTLLISKASEALQPDTEGNQVGEGGTIDELFEAHQDALLVVNGGFNHYRHNFYAWPHQNYQVGDPASIVKIRSHTYLDNVHPENVYGFLTQTAKRQPWRIATYPELDGNEKYFLGSVPLLIHNTTPLALPPAPATFPPGEITPPSVLTHSGENHPRTAVGVSNDGSLVFVLVEEPGCTLQELQHIGVDLGLESFLNLDGGGSSQFRARIGRGYVGNKVAPADQNRVLGHVLMLFASQPSVRLLR